MMWVEAYRPKSLSQILGQDVIVERLQAFVKDKEKMPHFLFAGPPGCGKTSAAIALARDIFQDRFAESYKELNASDERGIKMVREDVKKYASLLPAPGMPFRIIVLDEADNMTSDAQQALRRTMEKYKKVRFVLIANYSSKIISPIQSRTAVFRFRPIDRKLIETKIVEIAKKETLEVTPEAVEALIEVSNGDLRRLLNIMQSSSVISNKVTEKVIHEIAGKADPKEINSLLSLIITQKMNGFKASRKKLRTLLFTVGISGKDILNQIHSAVLKTVEIPDMQKVQIVQVIGEIDFRLTEGANEDIQLTYLIAQMMAIMSKEEGSI